MRAIIIIIFIILCMGTCKAHCGWDKEKLTDNAALGIWDDRDGNIYYGLYFDLTIMNPVFGDGKLVQYVEWFLDEEEDKWYQTEINCNNQ